MSALLTSGTENNVGDVEEQLAEIERQFRLNESRIQTEALKKEQAMELELSAMKQKLAKLKQIPMAELPPDWTSQSEDVNRMVVTLPIPRVWLIGIISLHAIPFQT